ncbi:hypothetical protein [Thermodesulfobacterium sp.]|jgi:hypothetical protein|uniref:hypothetical protein n=1 Tax=Thermodesulfobacterium sp. TaxID=1965289 RepID=UPI000EE600CD|nr:hypothetical protein [Thermodesulfobacterium sp.]MBZ4681358.1 hypothetical protein [Thermodesulfobacterium sp.]MDI3476694.1 hypothetical protein [Thermoanaerobacterium sp.]HCP09592.1 hypothetical protein [Thermodesulfobacterium commune]
MKKEKFKTKTARGDPGAQEIVSSFLEMDIWDRLEVCLLNGKKCAEIRKLFKGEEEEPYEIYREPFQDD